MLLSAADSIYKQILHKLLSAGVIHGCREYVPVKHTVVLKAYSLISYRGHFQIFQNLFIHLVLHLLVVLH